MGPKELKKILDGHKLWLDSDGEKGTRANLRGADLTNANLINADLSYATLECADLKGAFLMGTNFKGACLMGTNFKGACLVGTNLQHANLKGANLSGEYLINADLSYADLINADLSYATLECARLENAILPWSLDNLPEGELIGYKKVQNRIVKLQILADSKRSRATSDKCRCDKALVLAIENIDGTDSGLRRIVNNRFYPTTYKVGKIVYADSWDENRWNECSHGIHFFLQRLKAVDW